MEASISISFRLGPSPPSAPEVGVCSGMTGLSCLGSCALLRTFVLHFPVIRDCKWEDRFCVRLCCLSW